MTSSNQSIHIKQHKLRDNFWERFDLSALTPHEWEALCDGCGTCCLVKLQDDDDDTVYYTSLACKLLDCSTGHCSSYLNRKDYVQDCLQLSYDILQHINWLPKTCAYRCLFEGRSLPDWHPLFTGTQSTVLQSGVSVANRCQSEENVHEDDAEDYIVRWVKV